MSTPTKTTTVAPSGPIRTHQPTYRLESKYPFSAEKVEKIVHRIIEPELEELEYNDKVIPELCLNLAETIKNEVKEEHFDRYRLIVVVSIGQKRQQSVQISHSYLWDEERDMFASHFIENNHVYVHTIVYAVYLD